VNPDSNLGKALADCRAGISAIYVWPMLAWQEIRLRYRRSLLGPFWITISTAVLLGGIGPLYGKLFQLNLATYLPHLTIGYVLWLLFSGLINEGCQIFITARGLITQMRMPLTVHVLRTVTRNLIIFAHHAIVVVAVLVFYPPVPGWELLLVPVGILLIAVNGFWAGLLIGMFCARFRDIPPTVESLVQVAFFLTPVLWQPQLLGRHQWAAAWNPLYHFLEIVRAPLMGMPTSPVSWTVVLGITLTGCLVTLALFARYRARIAYWV
jgi:ABC-type polysaccharide/polyol phosphate export permease